MENQTFFVGRIGFKVDNNEIIYIGNGWLDYLFEVLPLALSLAKHLGWETESIYSRINIRKDIHPEVELFYAEVEGSFEGRKDFIQIPFSKQLIYGLVIHREDIQIWEHWAKIISLSLWQKCQDTSKWDSYI